MFFIFRKMENSCLFFVMFRFVCTLTTSNREVVFLFFKKESDLIVDFYQNHKENSSSYGTKKSILYKKFKEV
ncbi:hypothetical protein BS1321_06650 [Peribacillus simplex NBRC 15720 = DSM 1321]|uniref:Uncharacterized protein n=1 Tax=Peribacillus simplex NBRC 15720 = DSM 1321 TaxID=1349754 RepID=A0A223EEJ9_9BACI|nr:hypothetical protein BS1321_06650 [Peribacillus simplex NBRC 15720 = DSM 1321]